MDQTGSTRTMLVDPLSDHLKKEIVHQFWHRPNELIKLEDYAPYFKYYEETCSNLHVGIQSTADTLAVHTHEELLLIVKLLWAHQESGSEKTRVSLRDSLRAECFNEESDERINGSIDLALRLWLTMNIGKENSLVPSRGVPWNDVSCLSSFAGHRFKAFDADDSRARIVLGRDLSAVKLYAISGITITWTGILDDHLFYIKDKKTVKVYDLDRVLREHRMR